MRGFLLCVIVLTTLPGCSLFFKPERPPDPTTPDPGFNLVRGPLPRADVVFCDVALTRRCATPLDIQNGIRLSEAAVALNEGRSSGIGIDDSPAAMERCRDVTGGPEAVLFDGMFPEGLPVCVNCAEVVGPGKVNADAAAVCQAYCYDLVLEPPNEDGLTYPVTPPTADTIDGCRAAASVSVNMTLDACIANACDDAGTLTHFYVDPRRVPEAVVWTDVVGAEPGGAAGNDLIRTMVTTGAFDTGAISQQRFTRGYGFVEFSAAGGFSQIVGLSQLPVGCSEPCSDGDATDGSIHFGVLVRYDGAFFVYESGVQRAGPGLDGSFGPSMPGDRFRVFVRDNADGTASVLYTKLVGTCTPGALCNETIFYTSTNAVRYPLRVDSSLFHQGATVTDVRVMRIK